jgi:hypothetical protein
VKRWGERVEQGEGGQVEEGRKDVNLISSKGNSRTVTYCSESFLNFSTNEHYAKQFKGAQA